jgi:hypothetical protein
MNETDDNVSVVFPFRSSSRAWAGVSVLGGSGSPAIPQYVDEALLYLCVSVDVQSESQITT